MGKHVLRDDKQCQNCGHTVEEIYCPQCGQKNTETRQSFGHLVAHFVEDFVHYDGAFWKTIKYLLFRPGRLTKEYLAGKRQSYVPPVKLYIFISFLTFFIPAILPDQEYEVTTKTHNQSWEEKEDIKREPRLDEMEDVYPLFYSINTKNYTIKNPMTYTSVRQMDSIEKLKPDSLQLDAVDYAMAKKMIKLYQHNTPKQVAEKFEYAYSHNIPKVIFIYMPLFAFWLWLFHGKKKWYFFDHGIFTLHYFSFLLLTLTAVLIIHFFMDLINLEIFDIIFGFIALFTPIWMIYYFYRAHRKVYAESFVVNWLKSTVLFFINIIAIIIMLIYAGFVTLYNLH